MLFRTIAKSLSVRWRVKKGGSSSPGSDGATSRHLKPGAVAPNARESVAAAGAAAAAADSSARENPHHDSSLLAAVVHTPASIDITAQDYLSIQQHLLVGLGTTVTSQHATASDYEPPRPFALPPADPLQLSRVPSLQDRLKSEHIYIEDLEVSSALTTRASSVRDQAIQTAPDLDTLSLLHDSQPAEYELKIMQRKIWVKRPGASATLVTVNDDDLVDTVRDSIIQKYANSLGRSVDSPDITLKIVSREQGNKNVPAERTLQPDESIARTLDSYYPGGQTIEDALVIDLPQRRTPKPSPRVGNHHHHHPVTIPYPYFIDDLRPGDGAREYFPPMPAVQSPHLPNNAHHPHAMSVLTTGQLPALPSPGGHQSRKHQRPKYPRQHTSSPTILHSHQSTTNDSSKAQSNGTQAPAPSLPTPPPQNDHRPSLTPPNRASSPPHQGGRPKRSKKQSSQGQSSRGINGEAPPPMKPASAGLLDGTVPPINVLIVEDNPINLRLLEAFMRRLQVRWKSAVNGREAVNVWRTGGFHLVLMDIQLPVMSGLEATKEIRRLEGVNGIGLGVFGGTTSESKSNGEMGEGDRLEDMSLFKSPVIIVALTASSLQSDRHEALAAGCNDFLTKPVNYPWMERKVTEWGCMQALIDFDGWRKWKAYAAEKDAGLTEEQKKAKAKDEKAKQKAALKAMFTRPPPSSSNSKKKEESKEDKKEGTSPKPTTNGTGNATSSTKGHKRNSTGGASSNVPILETHHEVDAEDDK